MRTIKHIELKGGYSMGRKIIIDACEISANKFYIMALYENGDEIDSAEVETEPEALKAFDKMVNKYAEPLQKSIYNAALVEGEKYTIAYCNDFGFPVACKIIFKGFKLCTYAQFSDCVKLIFRPFKKRSDYSMTLHNQSFMIFKGWQDLRDEDIKETISDNGKIKMTRSKYACFDSRYIDDMENLFKNPVVIYKDFKIGSSGKTYA